MQRRPCSAGRLASGAVPGEMAHSSASVQALLSCTSNRDLLFVQTDLLKRFDEQFVLLCDAAKLAEEQKDESKARG